MEEQAMNSSSATLIELRSSEGNLTILARPRDSDEQWLNGVLGERQVIVGLDDSADTSGHAASDELVLDVEGHAVTVRLPTAADAAALRRGFAVGVVTASLVIGGVAAAVTGADLAGRAAEQQAIAPAGPAVELQPVAPLAPAGPAVDQAAPAPVPVPAPVPAAAPADVESDAGGTTHPLHRPVEIQRE
jgi:hypothetical protein